MPVTVLAAILGAALVIGMDRALPGIMGLERIAFEVPLGTPASPPTPSPVFAQLVLLHLLVAVAGGALAAAIAPAGHKMMGAASVAFLGSVGAALTGVFQPSGPDWYHGLAFAVVLIGPCVGGNLASRAGSRAAARA